MEEVDKLNAADGLIFQTEKQLKEYGDKLPADKKQPIEGALAELKTAHQNKDFTQIDTAMASLNTAWQAASEEMYKAGQDTQGAAEGNPQGDPTQQNPEAGNVTDVDFEEVKEDKK